jgi:hypothetical protein
MNIICEGPLDDNQRPIVKYLPADESYSDYLSRLEELVASLSILEERPAVEIAREMARSVKPSLPPSGSLVDELITELERYADSLSPGKDPRQVAIELQPLLTNAELMIQQCHFDKKEAFQQAALLAARFTKIITAGTTLELLVWRLCDLVLAQVGLRLCLSTEQLNNFYSIAVTDDPNCPDELLVWINDHAKPAESFKKNKKQSNSIGLPKSPDDSGGPAH